MGISSHPSLVSLTLKDFIEGSDEVNNNSSYLWSKVLEAQSKKVEVTKKRMKSRRTRRISMKRRIGCRRGSYGIQRRVRTLKSLIPNSDDSIGLDGLFRETANYILSLQTRVRVMQVMVEVLNESDE
uniref:Transcription factor UPBEAT1-like n=1 Tax=Cicer arietinum TaxID=3827 RepID=A0A1S2XY93_CICAR|nr:transcription factor UPBEAT1-like [Cicer arietinum]